MKYLIYTLDGIPQCELFSETRSHAAVAHGLTREFKDNRRELCEIVSAGFCEVSISVRVFGSSDSLGLSSRPEDSEIIEAELSRRSLQSKQLQTV